jgi:thiosulfate/3-mercaptopyruvate sulfurtransferase
MTKSGPDGPVMKAPEEVMAESAGVGLGPDTPTCLACFKGARATNRFLVLKEAGVEDVQIYFNSRNEWSRDPPLPIEDGLPYGAG